MKIAIPELGLVALVGASGSGKSTFAAKHFLPTEVISSDFCRGLVSDDENDPSVTPQAFELVHEIARKQLALGRLMVIDATNVQDYAREPLIQIAREFHRPPVAIVFNLPEKVCVGHDAARPGRSVALGVIQKQRSQLHDSLERLVGEGFSHVFVLESRDDVNTATVERKPL